MIGVTIVFAVRAIARTVVPQGDVRPDAPLLGPRIRGWYVGLMTPLAEQLIRWGVHPDTLTYAQLGVSVAAGAAFAAGWMFLAGWLTILAGTLDILDGFVARRIGVAGPRGALVDSLIDRYAEFATFLGVGAYFRDGWVLVPVAVAAFASQMVSYTRARAEGLGLRLDGGSAQRPERYVVLGLGAVFSGLVAHLACPMLGHQTHFLLALAIVVLAAVAAWTALQRAVRAVQALPPGAP